jgi:hypothetical protein
MVLAQQGGKCEGESQAVKDALDDLKQAPKATWSEWMTIAGAGITCVGAVVAAILALGPGTIGGTIAIAGAEGLFSIRN